MKKTSKKRWLINIASLCIFVGAVAFMSVVSINLYKNYQYNLLLKAEKEKIQEELENMEDERYNEDYYDIYVKDGVVVYDEDIVIEFPN